MRIMRLEGEILMKNFSKISKLQKETIVAFGILLFVALFQALRCIEFPGLYLDAVNPDYLAVQFLFPQIKNPQWTLPHTSIPFLGQLYHGTVTVWLQVFIIGITGSASILTLRIANAIYVLGICWCIYLICKRVRMNRIIALAGIIAMIVSPQVYSFIRTQYYIKLPGAFLLLLSLYFLIMFSSKKEKGYLLLISGATCGLAFYSYFIYLFFVPAMVILCFYQALKNHRKKGKDVLTWLTGFSCGASLYIVGYFDLLITCSGLDHDIKKTIVYVFAIILFAFIIYLASYIIRNFNESSKMKKLYLIILFFMIVGGIMIIANLRYILSVITPYLDSLNVAGKKMSLIRRVGQFFIHWYNVMTNSYSEQLMLNTSTSIFSKVYSLVLIVLSILVGVIYVKYKEINMIIKMIGVFWLFICSYFLCSLAFISRMWGQHFTPVFFISYIIIILNLGYLYSVRKNLLKEMSLGVLIIVFMIGTINSNILNTNLKIIGGNGFYTNQINELAQNALTRKKSGEKEIYIFPEWGLLCGFNYLTLNQVPIMTEMDGDRLNELLAEGYNFQLCAWDREMETVYREKLECIGIENIKVEYVFSNDGSEAFYILFSGGGNKLNER